MKMLIRLIAPLLILLPLSAQPPQAEGQRREEPPKNLKLLKQEEMMPAMRSYTAALGVRCDFCHVQGDRASDDNPHKGTAREMIAMTRQVNSHFPDGKEKVTCYTCHRGDHEPKSAPPPPLPPPPAQ
jgi:hypothetical protein